MGPLQTSFKSLGKLKALNDNMKSKESSIISWKIVFMANFLVATLDRTQF